MERRQQQLAMATVGITIQQQQGIETHQRLQQIIHGTAFDLVGIQGKHIRDRLWIRHKGHAQPGDQSQGKR